MRLLLKSLDSYIMCFAGWWETVAVLKYPMLELLSFRRAKFMLENPQYIKAWETDLTSKIKSEIIDRMKFNLNFIIEIIGETGSGKSELGFNLNLWLQLALGYKGLTHDNYSFTHTGGLKLSQQYPERWTVQIDEQIRSYFGEGAKKELSSMQDLEDTVRASQSNFIFISPTHRAYHSGLHYIIRTWWLDYATQTNYCLVFEPQDIKLKFPIGYIAVKRPTDKEFLEFLAEYRARKMVFIQQVKNKGTRVLYYEDKADDAREIAKILSTISLPKLTKKKILSYIALNMPEFASRYTIGELSSIADMVKLILEDKD